MPRIMTDVPATWIGCKARQPLVDQLDDLADRGQLSRSEVIRLALERLVEEDLPPTLVESAAVRRVAQLHVSPPAEPVEPADPRGPGAAA
jgi:hypothetical protein